MKPFRNSQYLVYEDGRIFNTRTKRWLKPTKKKYKNTTVERLGITLHIDGEQKNFLYHRVLAEVFLPNPENKSQINHIDGNPLNNSLDNLEWATQQENNIHAIQTGLRPTKINQETANQIRKEIEQGSKHKDICKKYNIKLTLVSKIRNNISWPELNVN